MAIRNGATTYKQPLTPWEQRYVQPPTSISVGRIRRGLSNLTAAWMTAAAIPSGEILPL